MEQSDNVRIRKVLEAISRLRLGEVYECAAAMHNGEEVPQRPKSAEVGGGG